MRLEWRVYTLARKEIALTVSNNKFIISHPQHLPSDVYPGIGIEVGLVLARRHCQVGQVTELAPSGAAPLTYGKL